ncbi:MAG: hypothetical protein M2R45_03176 [Verrucomicrobia subdivision 3 bacterium]|nr:hypothetical protein [Limisphaerales bacterium]MCS1417749.1 hypothetical protein [Limisphaerales bacterium]
MTALRDILTTFCNRARSEREKGTYFEELTASICGTSPATPIPTAKSGTTPTGQPACLSKSSFDRNTTP